MRKPQKRKAIDKDGDFASNKTGEWVIYADTFDDFLLACRNVLESARVRVEQQEIEENFLKEQEQL